MCAALLRIAMRFSSSFTVLAIVAGSMLVACSSQTESDDASPSADDALIGGSSRAPYPAVVLVKSGNGRCSGTLIAPNLVLTARHCVDGDDRKQNGYERVSGCGNGAKDFTARCPDTSFTAAKAADSSYSVTTAASDSADGRMYAVDKIVRASGSGFCDSDLALMILAEKVPASEAKPMAPLLEPMDQFCSTSTTFAQIGFGVTSVEEACAGNAANLRRRIREDNRILCIPGHPQLGCERFDPLWGLASMPDTSRVTKHEWLAGQIICNGDSGGPAIDQDSLEKGKPVVIGVATRVGRDRDQCTYSVFQRVDVHAATIKAAAREAAAAGDYAVPPWAK